MLPPPTTRPSCTPSAATALSSPARRSMNPKSSPPPAPRSPRRLPPRSSAGRGGRRAWARRSPSAASQLEPREPADADVFARLRDQRLHQIAHRARVVLDEFLLQQHGVLEELLEAPLDDLRPDR